MSGPVDTLPRVLIVDDRRESLVALEAVLDSLDVQVVRAMSGTEAIDRCTMEEFAVVVLDVMMPGADGLETARRLKALGASRLTPIIFLTAVDADRRRIHDGYASGAVDYLFKPVDPDLLRAKVAAFVELYRHRLAEHWQQRRRYADQMAEAAAAASRDGDQRFMLLAESVPAMVWTANANGRVEFMNAYGSSYVGIALDQVTGTRWSELIHPDDIAATRTRWKRAVRTGEPYESEVRIWNPERVAWRRHLARAQARRDANGKVVGWVGVNTDVEDSIRAEAEAHELQLTAEREARIASDDARVELARAVERTERLQSLTAALSEAATPADVATAVVTHGVAALKASAGVITIAERDPAGAVTALRVIETIGYDESVITPWREIPIAARIPLTMAARTRQPVTIGGGDERLREFPDLEGVPMQHAAAYALPLIAQDAVVGVMGLSFAEPPVLTDEDRALADAIGRQCAQALHRAELFAAERRAREEAETARRRMTFLSDAGAALNQTLDFRETLQALADAAVPFLADYALVDMLDADGQPERLAHACRESEHSRESLEAIRGTGTAPSITVPLRARDRTLGVLVLGRYTRGQLFTEAELRLAEELARRAGTAIDSAKLYEAAQEANRAKAAFLAAVSHDLRQPLNASLGFLDIALMGLRGEVAATLREDLERVRRNQQHLLALINDVLSFARVEAGQLIVRREVVPLTSILDELPALVSLQADAKRVTLDIASCSPLLALVGDRDRVVQVFTNLLTNAVKATPEGGSVLLRCEAAGDVVLARVADTGVGIPPEMFDQIFEPFVQVRRSLNRPEDGIGLGLSISRNLVRAMGGELTVESSVGSGSVFTLRLPRAPLATPAFPMAAVQA